MYKIIIIFSICIVFVINGILFGWEATRRSGEEVQMINSKYQIDTEEQHRRAEECIKAGGRPDYYTNRLECKKF